jgi:hypothetical protein
MSADVASRVYRAESWIKRARESAQHLDGQFIFYWIALNALYGQRGSENGPPRDRNDLHTFLGRIASRGDDTAVSVMERLAILKSDAELVLGSEFLYEDYWTTGFTDALAVTIDRATARLRSWPNRDFARDLINIFDRLATLRNQMVHGSSKDGSGANRASVEPAVRILADLVPVLSSVVEGHADEDWGPLPFPAKGRSGHPDDFRTR